MRKQLFAATRPDPGFRWRGTDVGRLEGLSDAVFGFAIMGLSIVSVAVAFFGGLGSALLSGLIYLLVMTPMLIFQGIYTGRRRAQLLRQLAA